MHRQGTTQANRSANANRGVALLAILWLSMAVSLLAFSTAYIVRTESAQTSNEIDLQRAHYMARGGMERAIYEIVRARRLPSDDPQSEMLDRYRPGKRWMRFPYSQGRSIVQVVPENAKLSVNGASMESLQRLLEETGQPAEESAGLADAIRDWRSTRLSDQRDAYDQYYASLAAPVAPLHSPLQDIEEILHVRGMTSRIFYGGSVASGDGKAIPCVPDLLSVSPAQPINVNFAPVEVMASLPGWDRSLAESVVAERLDNEFLNRPFSTMDDLVRRVPPAANVLGVSSVTLASGDTYTLIATGLPSNSSLAKSIRALVRIDLSHAMGYQLLGWWDDWPWSPLPDSIRKDNR